MPNDRLARFLLRLYPRSWRERYGEEFLALVADTGLSSRAVADVVVAAAVERTHVVVALLRGDRDAATSVAPTTRDTREALVLLSFVTLSVVTLGAMGVAYPRWVVWGQILFSYDSTAPASSSLASWFDRGAARCVVFARAMALAGFAWMTGFVLASVGIPEPPDWVFYSVFGLLFVSLAARWIYLMVRPQLNFSKWPVMGESELLHWKLAGFAVVVLACLGDGTGEAFWSFTGLFWIFGSIVQPVTRQGVALRRAQHEAIFGRH